MSKKVHTSALCSRTTRLVLRLEAGPVGKLDEEGVKALKDRRVEPCYQTVTLLSLSLQTIFHRALTR